MASLTLPGFVNAHSHAFQRALRGRVEGGDFWAWRDAMYVEAEALSAERVRTQYADVYREMIGSALDAYLSVSSFRLNETMRTMTALATILMSMTLISGIYGMNFDVMPELGWSFGYPFALVLMALVGGAVALWFRRRKWL